MKHIYHLGSFCCCLPCFTGTSCCWNYDEEYGRNLISLLIAPHFQIGCRRWKTDEALPIVVRMSISTSPSSATELPIYWNLCIFSMFSLSRVIGGITCCFLTVIVFVLPSLIHSPIFSEPAESICRVLLGH